MLHLVRWTQRRNVNKRDLREKCVSDLDESQSEEREFFWEGHRTTEKKLSSLLERFTYRVWDASSILTFPLICKPLSYYFFAHKKTPLLFLRTQIGITRIHTCWWTSAIDKVKCRNTFVVAKTTAPFACWSLSSRRFIISNISLLSDGTYLATNSSTTHWDHSLNSLMLQVQRKWTFELFKISIFARHYRWFLFVSDVCHNERQIFS